MRIANVDGRASGVVDDTYVDIAEASGGRFGPDPMPIFEQWGEFVQWASEGLSAGQASPLGHRRLGAPVPSPRQVFAIGLNYSSHAAESESPDPEFPPTFTKFPTCIAGPYADVALRGEYVDWEVELVVVIGRMAYEVPESSGWVHVAGLMVGQDISDRVVQLRPPSPQFSLGKSFPNYGPTGPWVVTPDEFNDVNDLELRCEVSGDQVQKGRTSELIFNVPALVNRLSSVTPLLPGDLVFTGTPAGVGVARTPPRFLKSGDVLTSTIEGIGTIQSNIVERPTHEG
jgi:2,4-didehydro-3-deoxy-L-rhamnonate hydrolase